MFWNAVYYPNWRIYRDQPPVSLNFDVLSHVFYAFAWSAHFPTLTVLVADCLRRVKPDGTVYVLASPFLSLHPRLNVLAQ